MSILEQVIIIIFFLSLFLGDFLIFGSLFTSPAEGADPDDVRSLKIKMFLGGCILLVVCFFIAPYSIELIATESTLGSIIQN